MLDSIEAHACRAQLAELVQERRLFLRPACHSMFRAYPDRTRLCIIGREALHHWGQNLDQRHAPELPS